MMVVSHLTTDKRQSIESFNTNNHKGFNISLTFSNNQDSGTYAEDPVEVDRWAG